MSGQILDCMRLLSLQVATSYIQVIHLIFAKSNLDGTAVEWMVPLLALGPQSTSSKLQQMIWTFGPDVNSVK